MRNTQNYDKIMLNEYLNKFSKEQLMDYFDIVAEYSFQDELFMEVHELSDLLQELNRQVRCIDPSFPSVMDDEAKDFFVDNPLYFFDYLKKDVIADMLCRYIYYNVIMAEITAETLYNCGRDDAMQYPMMVLEIQAQLGPMFKVLM
jgi:hypothetical protein